jgi:trehalose-phosphatase
LKSYPITLAGGESGWQCRALENKVKHLFEDWEKVRNRIQKAANVFLFLDYDGTLTPIVSRPDLAHCPKDVSALLEKLRDYPKIALAIISGRSLEDLKEKIGVPGLIYVGNHGLEIENPAGQYRRKLSPPREEEMRRMKENLQGSFSKIPGILLEDKGPILAIHYRNVPPRHFGWIRDTVEKALQGMEDRWEIASGKMVYEIRPRIDFNKAQAVQGILKRSPFPGVLPIYVGDDRTDEDVFRAVKGLGINIFIGPGGAASEAEYYLNDPPQVHEFLLRLEALLKPGGKTNPGSSGKRKNRRN